MTHKEVLPRPAGDANYNICRHCHSNVSTVTNACSTCGSTQVANCAGFYWENGKVKKLKLFTPV